MNIDPHRYNITIRRDSFEGEVLFEARVRELPDLTEYGESYDEAYGLAVDAIETAAQAFQDKGREFPSAITPADDFSGRVTLRLPRSLHRCLSQVADDEGVSLNQQMINVLSYYSGFASSKYVEEKSPWVLIPQKNIEKTARKTHLKMVRCDDLMVAVG